MLWTLTHRCDPTARVIADRHYNRQSVGADNFAPPGRALVLRHPRAFWISSWPFVEYVHHAWPGAWVCSAFRLEGGESGQASALIRSALAVTHWALRGVDSWREAMAPTVPAWRIARGPHASRVDPVSVCMVTMVDREKTTRKRDPGRCFRRAGFVEIGETKVNKLVVLGLPVESLPPPEAPIGAQASLFA